MSTIEGDAHFLGLSEFVEGMAFELVRAPFKLRYRSRSALTKDVARIVGGYLRHKLVPLQLEHALWETIAENGPGIQPVYVFGADFIPDLAVDVQERPTVALRVNLIRESRDTLTTIATAIGEAIVFSCLYPSVVAFVYSTGAPVEYKHLLDRQIAMDLWRDHKIRLVLR